MAITQLPPQPDSKPVEHKPWRETPLIESTKLSKAAGCRIHLKLETIQPSGSFKSRGIGNLMLHALSTSANPQKTHFYSSSGGNAGLACVTAAVSLNRPATVVVPLSTKPAMVEKIRIAGAWEVLQRGASWKEADAYLRDEVMGTAEARGEEAVYVPPFDDPEVWKGNETLVPEISKQLGGEAPDVVVCSVGGGGLFNGIVQGVLKEAESRKGAKWSATQVLAVETKGADSLANALAQGEHATLGGITSQATSLGATRVSGRCYELATKYGGDTEMVKSAVLSDAEAAMGCWRFADDERMLVELACGVSLAVCYGGRLERCLGRKVGKDENVVIVVCGGSNVSASMIEQWRANHGAEFEGELGGKASNYTNGTNGINGAHGG